MHVGARPGFCHHRNEKYSIAGNLDQLCGWTRENRRCLDGYDFSSPPGTDFRFQRRQDEPVAAAASKADLSPPVVV
jgi:hypothetical protein